MDKHLSIVQNSTDAAVKNFGSDTLVGRGLASIKRISVVALEKSLDLRYRKARESFNSITDDGNMHFDENPYCFPVDEMVWCRSELQNLADMGYGKAYLPLHFLYRGGYGIPTARNLSIDYLEKAWDWCFSRQLEPDTEIWDDLGTLCRIKDGLPKFTKGEFRVVDNVVVNVRDDHVHYFNTNPPTNNLYQTTHIWYEQAAEEGNSSSMNNLCRMYESGAYYTSGFDRRLALCWQIAAAEEGNANAQYGLALKHLFEAKDTLGKYYIFEDEEIGYEWMVQASINGNCYAKSFLLDTFSAEEVTAKQRSIRPVKSIGVKWDLNEKDIEYFRQVAKRLSRLGKQWSKP